MKTRALSLFTGAGGLDIGFHRIGFDIVACIEIESIFCETLELNLGPYFSKGCKVINSDIRDVEPATLDIEPIDLIIGGPPCQSFSAAGRRAGGITGILDERGSLFEQYCRFVRHFEPKAFIFENVRGILQANKGKDWEEILNTFRPLGYSLYYKVLDAADYGVPQYRERLILVGVNDVSFLFPRPTHGPDASKDCSHLTPGEAIADLQPENEPINDYGGKYGKLLQEVPPGMNYHYFTKEMGHPNPVFAWRSRFSDFLYKADPDKPVKTIVAKLGRYSGPFHWKSRKFTLEEFKRLQSFPDDYKFAGTLNQQLQQIGNSVAPRFAEALAAAIKSQLFDPNHTIELLPRDYKLSFDRRKSEKAKQTRRKRLSSQKKWKGSVVKTYSKEKQVKYFLYSSVNCREPLDGEENLVENAFCFHFNREGENLSIDVSRYWRKRFLRTLVIRYVLSFHHPIGNGITQIECNLRTNKGEDVPIAWDAVEIGLSWISNYHSLMDIYGHFTEPHPIFTLTSSIHHLRSDPIIRFAKHFSEFKNTITQFPAEELKQIMGGRERFDFLDMVKSLRNLRFDVRVHETNPTIPPQMFRCCYPFTIGYDKQVSVTWKERENGNQGLVV